MSRSEANTGAPVPPAPPRPAYANMTRERATILTLLDNWRQDFQQMLDQRSTAVAKQGKPTQRDLIELAAMQARVDAYANASRMIRQLP